MFSSSSTNNFEFLCIRNENCISVLTLDVKLWKTPPVVSSEVEKWGYGGFDFIIE